MSKDLLTENTSQHVLQMFDSFRMTLDAHYDKRERIIKLSRDITAHSKKMIFLLHRLSLSDPLHTLAASTSTTSTSTSPSEPLLAVSLTTSGESISEDKYAEVFIKEREIRQLLRAQGQEGEFWRYQQNITGGLQEYIEAISLLHYLTKEGTLISIDEVQNMLKDESGKPFLPVTPADYVLGLSDLSGELMRFTLNAIAKGQHEVALKTLGFVREMKSQFDPLMSYIPYLDKKQEITDQSLRKIENAAYQISLRRQEFAGQDDILAEMIRRELDGDMEHGAGLTGGREQIGTKRKDGMDESVRGVKKTRGRGMPK
ncbi:Translin-associated protein X [Phaffia rhodozyma]|uniref:Translin-associated protein X n=1 Tax=Phaffia rhodozyma TaxID=264483 RepID=A0A0F7SW69_PHARH|nr:Translin-associated protein X [Phaffia rhodozyma]